MSTPPKELPDPTSRPATDTPPADAAATEQPAAPRRVRVSSVAKRPVTSVEAVPVADDDEAAMPASEVEAAKLGMEDSAAKRDMEDAAAKPTDAGQPLIARLSSRYPALAPYLARADLLALALIVLVAFLIRIVNLGHFPDTFNPDESDNTEDALRIIYGAPPENGFFGFDWKPQPAFSIYMLSMYIRIFGETIFAARLPSALISTLALIPFYFLLRRQLSVIASLLATVLLATNLWYLNFSRSVWENVHISFYMLMAMLFLNFALDGLRKKSIAQWWTWFSFGATGFFCALGIYGYFGGRAIVLVVIAFFPVALWFYRRRWGKLLFGYIVTGVVIALLIWPEVAYVTRPDKWNFFNRRSETVLLTNTADYKANPVGTLLNSAGRNLRGFWYGDVNTTPRYTPEGQPLLDSITGALVLVGMLLSIGLARFRRRPETYLWWLMFLVSWGFTEVITTRTPDGARGVGWMPTLLFFAAIGIEGIVLLSARLRGYRWVAVAATAAILLLVSYSNASSYFNWQGSALGRVVRGPYVANCEFSSWVGTIKERTLNHQFGFPVGEWLATHPRPGGEGVLPCDNGAPVAAQTNPTPAPQPPSGQNPPSSDAVLPSTPREQWPAPLPSIGNGELLQPRAVAVDSVGNVYVIDSAPTTQSISKYGTDGKLIKRWGGPGGADDNDKYQSIQAIVVDKADEVLVLDETSYWIHVYDKDGKFLRKWGGPTLLMFHPRAMTIDANDHVYIADTGSRRVLVFDVNGGQLAELGNKKSGIPDAEQLVEPGGVAAAADGSFFVGDSTAGLLRSYSASGRQQTSWSFVHNDPQLGPRLALAPDGSIYATAPTLCAFVRYDKNGVAKEAAGSCDSQDYLAQPSGLAIAGGKLYVTDLNQKLVHVFALPAALLPPTPLPAVVLTMGAAVPVSGTATLSNTVTLTMTTTISATGTVSGTNK